MPPAQIALIAVKALTIKDSNGDTMLKHMFVILLVFIIGAGLFLQLCASILLTPLNFLQEIFLPQSVKQFRRDFDSYNNRPVISLDEESFLAMPVEDTTVSSGFGGRQIFGSGDFHEGTDFPVAFGSQVSAVADGTVIDTGVNDSYGSFVLIKHEVKLKKIKKTYIDEDGIRRTRTYTPAPYMGLYTYYTFYAHLWKVYVFEGEGVSKGEVFASSGGDPSKHFAGRSTGAHLHFEVRTSPKYGSHIDPYNWILKPLSDDDEEIKGATVFIVNGRKQGADG
jgi:murein DD-endopeptidase MepM/ murein hydrolase activator NlpD